LNILSDALVPFGLYKMQKKMQKKSHKARKHHSKRR
jgi:hypothetical protein